MHKSFSLLLQIKIIVNFFQHIIIKKKILIKEETIIYNFISLAKSII
jgi:hypothetical protein